MQFDPQYSDSIALIMSLEDHLVRSLDMPEEDAVHEGQRLHEAVKEEYDALLALGCPQEYLDTLPLRLDLFSYLANYFLLRLDETENLMEIWMEKKSFGYTFRRKLFSAFRVAYRHFPKLLEKVENVIKGKGDTDMVMDLRSLQILGTAHPAQLQAVNFDLTRLDDSLALHHELLEILAKSNLTTDEEKELREIRNRAYSWLREAMDEIRTFGQWLHEDDEEKRLRYISLYHHELGTHAVKTRWDSDQDS